jgi:hypothetical protein
MHGCDQTNVSLSRPNHLQRYQRPARLWLRPRFSELPVASTNLAQIQRSPPVPDSDYLDSLLGFASIARSFFITAALLTTLPSAICRSETRMSRNSSI